MLGDPGGEALMPPRDRNHYAAVERVDLERFRAAVREGLTSRALAERFGLSPRTAAKWRARVEEETR